MGLSSFENLCISQWLVPSTSHGLSFSCFPCGVADQLASQRLSAPRTVGMYRHDWKSIFTCLLLRWTGILTS